MTTSAFGSSSIVSSDRLTVLNPACRAVSSTATKCSGRRGAMMRQRMRRQGANPLERRQHHLAFAGHRAAGHDHRSTCRHFEKAQHPLGAPAECRRPTRGMQRVELEAAGDGDAIGRRPEADQPPGRFLALHAETIHQRQHAPEHRPHELVPRIRPGGDPPVDHDRLDAAFAAAAQQIGPDLGFHHHEQARANDGQHPIHDKRQVERKIEDAVGHLKAPPGHLLPGHRRRGDEEPEAGVSVSEFAGDRARRQRLTHRDRVNPD